MVWQCAPMPYLNEIQLTQDEASQIPDQQWKLVETTEDFRRYEAKVELPNGMHGTVRRTEFLGGDILLAQNAEARKENSERRYTAGMGSDKGGNMPFVHTASIPLNVYYRDIAKRQAEGDKDHLRWYLRQPENGAYLVRDAKGLRK